MMILILRTLKAFIALLHVAIGIIEKVHRAKQRARLPYDTAYSCN